MGELLDYLNQRYSNKNSVSEDVYQKVKVKTALYSTLSKYLSGTEDSLIFEVAEKDLPYAVIAFEEDPIKSSYIIEQISPNTFRATPVVIEL